jgi:hypothetical protein
MPDEGMSSNVNIVVTNPAPKKKDKEQPSILDIIEKKYD